ncbi:hypothetical protein Ddc_12156 [Ditylenchus destructor]|nr:hypothetical protein Ddc_12156 [Ditylenchus destructor]
MNFVAYSGILIILSLLQYTISAEEIVFQVQGIIGCLTGENSSKIQASVEVGSFLTDFEAIGLFYEKNKLTEAVKLEDHLLGTLQIDNINSLIPRVVHDKNNRIMPAQYDDGEISKGQPIPNSKSNQPPPGSFAIRGIYPHDECPHCEKGVYLKLKHNCTSGDNEEQNLVYMQAAMHPVIKIEIPTKFITVRKSTDVSAVPKVFDIGKISW